MKLPYVIEDCPYTSEFGIRVLRGDSPEHVHPDDSSLCDVIKVQYAIVLEHRAIAAEAKVKRLEESRQREEKET